MKIDPEIETEWMRWQKEEHIPEILSTGLFTDHKFLRLLEQDDSDGSTYIVQFFSASKKNYDEYIENFSPALRKKTIEKWGDRLVAFRTVMELVQ